MSLRFPKTSNVFVPSRYIPTLFLQKFLLKKKVEIISHWQIGEHLNHRTKKLENNDFVCKSHDNIILSILRKYETY